MMLHKTAKILVIIGALNWGLVGFFNYNLVSAIFGSMMWLERFIYMLVGLSGLVIAFSHGQYCMMCNGMGMKEGMNMDMKMEMKAKSKSRRKSKR